MGDLSQEPFCSEFVEVDPTGRYGRYNEILGRGASKTVFRAFDEYEGIEVAWNQVKLCDFLQSPQGLERLYCEIHLLKTLKHRNIMKFYTSWVDTTKRNINFITEMFTSGTLKQYRQRYRRVDIRAVKHWCRQILRGLLYLHSHDPPVIHRDLKCDNIFINGNQGEVKIGDLGLAAFLRKSHAAHCVGTPEFMAPEVYEEDYNELVDIYSFGMCVLEMVTFEYPYSECTHPAQIYKKVISGTKPEALYKVKDPEVRQFVEKCLATASHRLPARELLKDPFLQPDDYDSASIEVVEREVNPLVCQPSSGSYFSNEPIPCGFSNSLAHKMESGWGSNQINFEQHQTDLFNSKEDEPFPNVDVTIKGRRREDGSVYLRLRITDKEGRKRNVYFPFDIEDDTALSVATEMVAELDIIDYDVTRIAEMIDGEISTLVPRWKPGLGIEDTLGSLNSGTCQTCRANVSSVGSLLNYGSGCNSLQGLHCSRLGCAAMHGRFEEITYQVDGSKQCKTEGPSAAPSQSEGIDLSLPSSPESHSGEERWHMDVPAKNVNSMLVNSSHVQSAARKSPGQICGGSIDRQCLETSKASYRPTPCNLSTHSEELKWHEAKYQMGLRDYKNQQLTGPWRALNLTSEPNYREQRMRDGATLSTLRPSQLCTAEALKSLHLGEKKYSFHHPLLNPLVCSIEATEASKSLHLENKRYSFHFPRVCNFEATSTIATSPVNGDGGLYWRSRHDSGPQSISHCKAKH